MQANTTIKWGIFLGVAVSLGTQILTWMGLGLTNWFIALTYLLVILFVVLSLGEIKKLEGTLTFPKAAASVVLLIIISRLIFQVYMFFYINYIDPAWVDTVAETWAQSLQEANISAEKIEQQINSFRKSYEPTPMFTVALFMFAIPQIILGLITAGIYVFLGNRN